MNVDVIIPTYNRGHCLRRAIDSVLNSTYKDYRLIIVDDGSTDDTKKICDSYCEIEYYYQKNLGVSAARNFGVSKGKSKYIAFLDSDDEWLPHKLEEQMLIVNKNSNAKLIHGEEIWIRNGKRINQKKNHKKGGGDQFLRCLSLCLISPSTVLIRRDYFNKYEGFDTTFEVCEDYDLWLKMTFHQNIYFVKEPIIKKYGGHPDQLSTKFIAMDFFRVQSMYNFYNKNKYLFTELEKKTFYIIILKKSLILKNGYLKHNNLENLGYIENIIEEFSDE